MDLTIRLLRRRIKAAQKQGTRLIVVDRFLRSLDQAHAFEEKIPAKTSGRIDDNPESVLNRLGKDVL